MISETDAAASSEWSTEVYPLGEIVLYQATLTGGAGATIQPRVGKATSWTDDTQDHIAGQSSAAAYISDATEVPYALATGQTLFGQSTVDSGTDNTVSTIIVIREGVAG